jgi:uncharacterized protein YndB with AHSA1/START domain
MTFKIEIQEQISSVRRELGTRVLEAGEARILTISQVYETGLGDMWTVVTDPARIERWFLPVTGDLTLGGKYQVTGNAGGTITACSAPHAFDATWEFAGQVSWIEVRLTAEGPDRTRFALSHIAHVTEHWEQYGPGATGIGWDLSLWGLVHYIGSPSSPLDPAAVEAWSTSAAGKEFLKLSSDAWAAADIASGEEPAEAQRRAGNTYAFYTGA